MLADLELAHLSDWLHDIGQLTEDKDVFDILAPVDGGCHIVKLLLAALELQCGVLIDCYGTHAKLRSVMVDS